jgi:hypothetical protein
MVSLETMFRQQPAIGYAMLSRSWVAVDAQLMLGSVNSARHQGQDDNNENMKNHAHF